MNKGTKIAIAGLLALFAGNAAATDGEIVFDGEILKSLVKSMTLIRKLKLLLVTIMPNSFVLLAIVAQKFHSLFL